MAENKYLKMPTVALRGMVMFPKMKMHFEVGRKKSISAVKAAIDNNQKIFLVAQSDPTVETPTADDLCKIGIVAEIKQIIRNPDNGSIRIVVEGDCRAEIEEVTKDTDYFVCNVKEVESYPLLAEDYEYVEALVRKVRDIFEKYISVSSKIAQDVASEVFYSNNIDYLTDFIGSNVLTDFYDKQALLEELDTILRLENLCTLLSKELDLFLIQEVIEQRVQDQMDKNQREYYLREQIKAISLELGEADDIMTECDEYKKKIASFAFPQDVEVKLIKEVDKLSKMQGNSVDANVIRNYLDECLSISWNNYTKDNFDLDKAKKIFDGEHYGMQKIKERFIEMLAVKSLASDLSGQIICLVGPPGVGKTSIVRSVAKAMGRKYVRMSLGGVRDEAEIRGHRKTYVGAMPGRIINSLKIAGSMNPIILLDEIDKLGSDYKGDPSSALLEALDPEQNSSFRDHYIEFPTDLSQVIFITTANDSSSIPAALYDRMEVIELKSYSLEEKIQIAKNHLLKKQRVKHGLTARQIKISDKSLSFLIDNYTREAGVRRLEQLIAALCRKVAVKIKNEEIKSITVTNEVIKNFLGPEKFRGDKLLKHNRVGVVNGLAWTAVGGEMLQVEAVMMDGTGKLELTGNLGEVMKESAKAAHSYLRSVADKYDIDKELFKTKDIHIHVPQGAVPKDGPSAGVTISTALLSVLSNKKVKQTVAMTGEISLTGRVMPIGGLKEKSMAAYKSGVSLVIIPEENEADLYEVNRKVKENVEFVSVSHVEEVFALAFEEQKDTLKKAKHSNITLSKNSKTTGAVAH